MTLPDEVRSHHTAWVAVAGDNDRPPVPVRYALTGESLVMFGDDELAGVANGTRVSITIHDIHDGPPLTSFGATLRDIAPADVDAEALGELVAHISLGHDLIEVNRHLDEIRERRRVVAVDA